jgi:hypothetical protein
LFGINVVKLNFVSPGRETVYAIFHLTDEDLQDIKTEVQKSGKYLKWFEVELKTAQGAVVARVKKQIYFRDPSNQERG